AGALVERIDNAARDLEARGGSTAERLDEAGTKFAGHLEQANALLGDRLSEAARGLDSELQDAMNTLSTRLESTSGLVGSRIEGASATVERAVTAFNTGIEQVLSDREEKLDGLVAHLGAKTSDVDAMMGTYTALIEEALDKAHGRTQDLTRGLAEQVGQTSQALQDEVRRIEAVADEQVSAAARTMREQYETVLASMGEMLASSNQSFGHTAQEMRATVLQVIEDIDSARAELKRTIIELPDETRANADAMRQVVSDQITALSALSDVVKRQSGVMELSGPGVHHLPPNGGSHGSGGSSPGKSEGAPSTAPQARTDGARIEEARSSDEADKSSEPSGNGATVHGRPVEVLARTAAARGTANLLPKLQGHGSGTESEPVKLARRTERLVSKLNAGARDLVHALDGGLDDELEGRFGAGEEYVYTHRLYVARRKLQTEIGARYGQEQHLRGRVDGFVQNFERLLDRIADAPRGQELADACLASESGKVYLMLAQASGRVETP
ncbi:MAG TPA: hypothetical protein VMO81_08500, partial [Aestuariivirgaceae bacterium]|nr:hypothetical protein [Aestuariivirgaceae bacterium]